MIYGSWFASQKMTTVYSLLVGRKAALEFATNQI